MRRLLHSACLLAALAGAAAAPALASTEIGAAVAAECYTDHSPPPPTREVVPEFAVRDRGAGRPTKRDRRRIDRLRGRGD